MTERYQNGKIYKLVSDMTDAVYIGSTCLPLYKRLYQHKQKTNGCCSRKLFELGGKVDIVLIEEFPTDNKDKLFARERFHIERNNCINQLRPIISEEERRECSRECKREYNQSDKRKACLRKYQQSDKRKACLRKYNQSEKGQACLRKYQQGEKCKANKREYYLKKKLNQNEPEYATLIFIE